LSACLPDGQAVEIKVLQIVNFTLEVVTEMGFDCLLKWPTTAISLFLFYNQKTPWPMAS
jgi:hypothetical protein